MSNPIATNHAPKTSAGRNPGSIPAGGDPHGRYAPARTPTGIRAHRPAGRLGERP